MAKSCTGFPKAQSMVLAHVVKNRVIYREIDFPTRYEIARIAIITSLKNSHGWLTNKIIQSPEKAKGTDAPVVAYRSVHVIDLRESISPGTNNTIWLSIIKPQSWGKLSHQAQFVLLYFRKRDHQQNYYSGIVLPMKRHLILWNLAKNHLSRKSIEHYSLISNQVLIPLSSKSYPESREGLEMSR